MTTRSRSLALTYGVALAVILLLSVSPLVSVLGAGTVAELAGCQIDEGSVHPCQIGGSDYGEMLYFLTVLGWFSLLTLPFGAVALMVWLGALVVHLVLSSRRSQGMP
ncbi:hypothetical protein E2F50_01195 [Rhizobium deserti]|uniref:Uncharacterized protein n=1 Tax=Rhizobium deserti TaxID=2547961 RepID=A0A4R5ULT1_9HYPH|nr:hypothetical protein [Rhizobium deserti]TDK38793.1 hypothetical protein E2F50_01195 [Rhizobium deserti]